MLCCACDLAITSAVNVRCSYMPLLRLSMFQRSLIEENWTDKKESSKNCTCFHSRRICSELQDAELRRENSGHVEIFNGFRSSSLRCSPKLGGFVEAGCCFCDLVAKAELHPYVSWNSKFCRNLLETCKARRSSHILNIYRYTCFQVTGLECVVAPCTF